MGKDRNNRLGEDRVEDASEDTARSPDLQARRLVYFAAERTLLSWVRASLSLMVLGFVVDRFGLFLSGSHQAAPPSVHLQSYSFRAGIALVALAVSMNLYAAVRYLRFQRRYRETGSTEPGHGLLTGVFVASLVACAGVAVAVVLITVG
jgi:putative membrane protein